MNWKVNSLLLFLLIEWSMGGMACHAKSTIRIESQKDFDGLKTALQDCLKKGEKGIIIEFAKGRYYYKHQHVYMTDQHFPGVSIAFKGNGSEIISAGKDMKANDAAVKYTEGAGFIDAEGRDFQNYSKMFQSDAMVEIMDLGAKRCRIHCPDLVGVRDVDCSNAKIRLTSWFTSFLYPATKIEDGYVYFTADNLAPGYKQYGDYNVNYDYTVGKILPRFRLINVPLGGCEMVSAKDGVINKSAERIVHQCESGYLVFLVNCEFKRLSIEGFNIIGSRADSQVLRFKSVKAESIAITESTVSAARGIVIYAEKTDNITVKDCVFHDNYLDVVSFSNSCANATIKGNVFYDNGKGVKNSFCIICRGGNYLIANNDIRDFNYGAIGVGVWHKAAKGSLPSYGVVERNHIYYTPAYSADKASWTLVDGGAIYLWTKNDGAVIRHNFIHDFEGMHSNRGIYCDDGTCNCSIYGNIILNIGNCYSIDLRRDLLLDRQDIGLKSNVNNHIYSNTFNNRFRFEGRDDDSSSVKGGNTILVTDENAMPRMVEANLVRKSEDKIVRYDQSKWYKKGQRLVR